jgi:hypothetical protein
MCRALIPLVLVLYGAGFAVLHAIYRWTTGFQVNPIQLQTITKLAID